MKSNGATRGRALAVGLALLAAIGAASAGPAEALEQFTVQGMLTSCKEGLNNDGRGGGPFVCAGYVRAIADIGQLQCTVARQQGLELWGIGAPAETSVGAFAQVFVNWAERNPDKWRWSALDGFMQALPAAFPCHP